MAKAKVSYRIQSQLVTIYNRKGDRVRDARKGDWRTWESYRNMVSNIEGAIKYIVGKMLNDRVGGIVVIRQIYEGVMAPEYTKIFQAKWGTDGSPFIRFDGVAGNYWMRRINPALLKRLEGIG